MATQKAIPLSSVVGRNLRFFREQRRQTQTDAARHLLVGGLRWSRDQVSTLETGNRESITFEELYAIAFAYGVPIAQLFAGDDDQVVKINDRVFATLKTVRESFSRQPTRLMTRQEEEEDWKRWEELAAKYAAARDEADKAVAGKLGYPVEWVISAAHDLWGHSLTEERDARLGDTSGIPARTLQAKRGAMTRKLTAEIAAYIKRENFPSEYVVYERRGPTGDVIERRVLGKGTAEEQKLADSPAWTCAGPYERGS